MITETDANGQSRFKRFFGGNTTKQQKRRSNTGLLLALVFLPVLLGVMACLPVPVGDPEKSRVDPALSGVWRISNADGDQMLLVLDPYDKRSWLMSLIALGNAAETEPGDENNTGQEATPQVRFDATTAESFKVAGMGIYKVWLTRIKGETFMTWESKTLSETLPGMVPDSWWVFRVRKSGADTFFLDSFDYSIDGLDEVTTRKQAEKIIRRHVGDPGFFNTEDSPRLDRLPETDVNALPALLEDFGIQDTL